MHTLDVFQWYNLFTGVLTVTGFLYLLTRNRSIGSYHRFVHVLVVGLLLFAVGGPLVDLVAPTLAHVVHTASALLVVYGLYKPIKSDLRRETWGNLILQDPSQLRHPADWMVPMDDEILELFHTADLVLTPSIIGYNTGYSREEVNRRLGELSERGLIERVERGKYRITVLGENYLTGQLSLTDVDDRTDGVSH